jgi:DNA-binding response OmpR family regulator
MYRALAIDDEEIVLLSVEKTLRPEGYIVDKALSAREALDKLAEETYDIIITDLMMPEMNGIELLGAIKEQGHDTPTVMVTGYPTIKTAIEALRLGAVDYVPKPFTRQELLSPVSRAVQRGREGSEAPGSPRYSVEASYLEVEGEGTAIMPGDEFVLRKHSFARYEQDGTALIGIEESFLLTVGVEEIMTITLPEENEIIEQGHASIKITTRAKQEHHVYMPLGGRVIAANKRAADEIKRGNLGVWVIRLEASKFQEQVTSLKKRRR